MFTRNHFTCLFMVSASSSARFEPSIKGKCWQNAWKTWNYTKLMVVILKETVHCHRPNKRYHTNSIYLVRVIVRARVCVMGKYRCICSIDRHAFETYRLKYTCANSFVYKHLPTHLLWLFVMFFGVRLPHAHHFKSVFSWILRFIWNHYVLCAALRHDHECMLHNIIAQFETIQRTQRNCMSGI